jgi:hypothetical protein
MSTPTKNSQRATLSSFTKTQMPKATASTMQVTTNQWGYSAMELNMPDGGTHFFAAQNDLPTLAALLQLAKWKPRT